MKSISLSPAETRAQAAVFKALGHPARLTMVAALAGGEMCVCDLTDLVELDMSTVSQHLSVLTAAGVLVSDKRANKVFYRLRTTCVLKVFTCLREAQNVTHAEETACCR